MRRVASLILREGPVRRWIRVAIGVCLAPIFALVVAAIATPLPKELAESQYDESVRVYDRSGRMLREVRAGDAARARWTTQDAAGDRVRLALLAAEDKRFYAHPGVDPIGVVRAAGSDLRAMRVVSGASTLTMQLARLVRPHPRTLRGKFGEMALALRIEASLDKRAILEQYENRAPFGPNLRGVEAASRHYFDKPASELSWAEAATLAAIPRGPAYYDPRRHADRLLARRDRVLRRLADAGWIGADERDRALAEPFALQRQGGSFGAPHLVRAVSTEPWLRGARDVTTTIDANIQREVEFAIGASLRPLRDRNVGTASAVVLDNATGDVLAYVGSADFDDPRGGQNDGARALRQPGSTLKPFVYGLAMERLGYTGATLLPDLELVIADDAGGYRPRDYDERFRGPVRLREALGSSLNVPAVWTLERVGTGALLSRLRELGFESLDQSAEHYGPALALGDGEVTLVELANAYATLARRGVWRPVRTVLRASSAKEAVAVPPAADARRVIPVAVADMVADILRDRAARVGAFGERSALELPFDVAAKTGTSKGFRDNWTVGFTRDVTVAVWVGNFDGSAMHGVSGITGAAPIFAAAMSAAMRGRSGDVAPLAIADGPPRDDLERVEVCALTGEAPGPSCTHRVHEWMPHGHAPLGTCHVHDRVQVDRRNGLLAGPRCAADVVEPRVVERWETPYAAWARAAGRPLAPAEWSRACARPGGVADGDAPSSVTIAYPTDGGRFAIDPGRPLAVQTLAVRIAAPGTTPALRLSVDGRDVGAARDGVVAWRLERGDHVMSAHAGAARSEPVRIRVE